MSDHPDSDLSPTLGGDRAAPEFEPAAAAEESAAEARGDGPAEPELPPELERLFAELGGADVEALVGQFGALTEGLQTFMTQTLQIVEERLPPTLAAFEGLIDAFEEALAPLIDDRPDGEA